MRRLFWVGVGAVGAVVAAERLRRAAHRYTPAGVTEQVEAAGQATTSAVHAAVERFRTSRAARENDLVAQLLVTPEGGDAGAVFGRHRSSEADGRRSPWAREPGSRPGLWAEDESPRAKPGGRVDEDEPLYDF